MAIRSFDIYLDKVEYTTDDRVNIDVRIIVPKGPKQQLVRYVGVIVEGIAGNGNPRENIYVLQPNLKELPIDESFARESDELLVSYPYKFPTKRLPSSYPRNQAPVDKQIYKGFVRYQVRAVALDRHWADGVRPMAEGSKMFFLKQKIDSNLPLYQQMPFIEGSKSQNLGCCTGICCWVHCCVPFCCQCCGDGKVWAKCQLERAAFTPGEVIHMTGHLRNTSGKKAFPYIALKQKVSCKSLTSVVRKWPLVRSRDALKGSVEFKLNARVPNDTYPPSLDCDLLKVEYFLETGFEVVGGLNLAMEMPIVIATEPFTGRILSPTDQKIVGRPMNVAPGMPLNYLEQHKL